MRRIPVRIRRPCVLAVAAVLLTTACSDSKASPSPSASTANPSPEATTERRIVAPPAPTSTDVAMIPVPAPTTFRGFPADILMISAFDGTRRPVTDQRDIEAAVPWPIVLPAYLPPGYDRIGLLQVMQPMANLPPDAAARTTRVMVAFRDAQPGGGLILTLSGGRIGTDATERLEVNGRPAEFSAHPVSGQNLAWDLCGRTLILSAPESAIPKSELIRIAESVPEQCD